MDGQKRNGSTLFQVTFARKTKDKCLSPLVNDIRKLPTYLIQGWLSICKFATTHLLMFNNTLLFVCTGQEFRALFISTSEPTTPEGETRDPTKSISDPAVFITAITRARSLIVAVGNPFMLLRREQHMVKKYGDRGHCWSLFLKACIDHGTLSVYQGESDDTPATVKRLKKMVYQRVSHLNLPGPLEDYSKFLPTDLSFYTIMYL